MGKKIAFDELMEMRSRLLRSQEHLNLSEEDMGELLGIERVTYRRITRGGQSITEEKFYYLIKELNISLDYLFTGKGDELLVLKDSDFTELEFNLSLDRIEAYVNTLSHNEKIDKLLKIENLKGKLLDTLRQ